MQIYKTKMTAATKQVFNDAERARCYMKIRIMMAAMLLLAGGLIALRAKTPPDNPEQQIRELEDKVNGAYAANDLTAYFSYYAPDFSQWLPEVCTDLATGRIGQDSFMAEDGLNPRTIRICTSRSVPAVIRPSPATSFGCARET